MVEEVVTEVSKGFSVYFYILIIALILVVVLIIFLIKKGRGNFKPNLLKVIVSILAIIFWVVLANYLNSSAMCKICVPPQCTSDYGNWMIIKPICDCSCQSFLEMLWNNLQHILIPFALVYIIWSLSQKK